MSDHERIFLEKPGAPDRCWCQDDVFEDGGIEFIRADIVASQLADARNKALEAAAACVESRIEDMRELDKFNRSYALRITALALADIRALKDVSINGR
ncbi:hypothetical protein G6K96_21800 [Agrobacterium vitis]|uniref:hypothetical protein n=1 Tax=Agrobacterium vitis TaxID=373 RepID=UPI001571DAFF|nr:hypothetical protein [Agrobacterium vitis]NTA34370.1 hypothetical protein [Agrobacterium vitis]